MIAEPMLRPRRGAVARIFATRSASPISDIDRAVASISRREPRLRFESAVRADRPSRRCRSRAPAGTTRANATKSAVVLRPAERLDQDADDAFAAEPDAEHDVVVARRVVGGDERFVARDRFARAQHDVVFEAAAADRAGDPFAVDDEHARAGQAIGRAFDADDGRERRGVSAARARSASAAIVSSSFIGIRISRRLRARRGSRRTAQERFRRRAFALRRSARQDTRSADACSPGRYRRHVPWARPPRRCCRRSRTALRRARPAAGRRERRRPRRLATRTSFQTPSVSSAAFP